MKIVQFIEKLDNYIELSEFVKLNRDSFINLKSFFDDNCIYEKMGYKHSAVTGMKRFENLLSDCNKYLDAKNNKEELPKVLERPLDMPNTPGDVNNCVVFYYFIFRENNLIKPEADNETLFQFLADSYGYKMYLPYFLKKEEFVLFCVLRWKSSVKRFNDFLSEEWCSDDIGDLEAIVESDREISVGEFIERIDELCNPMDAEVTIRNTRNSVAQSLENIDLIREEDMSSPQDDEGLMDFCQCHSEYAHILRTIQNTEPRRRWYLYRILQKIILKQMEYLNSTCKTVKDMLRILNIRGVPKTTMTNPFVVIDSSGDNDIYNYLFFFGPDYAECNQKLVEAKKAEKEGNYVGAAKIIFGFCEKQGENIYKINAEMIGKLRTLRSRYGKQLDEKLMNSIDDFLTKYEEHVNEKGLQDIILNDCYIKIRDIAYIFEVVFDDKVLHYIFYNEKEKFNKDVFRIARMTDDWVSRCLARGMNEDRILEIANEKQVMISNKRVNKDRIIRTRTHMEKHSKLVYDSNGNKGHGLGIRTDSEPGQLFKKILTGKANVSREMLLSFVLLAKIYSVKEELSWDYIKFHILENSRFDRNAEDGTPFNIFFASVKNALDGTQKLDNLLLRAYYLSDKVQEMELSYLKKGIAPFAVMFSGGDLD